MALLPAVPARLLPLIRHWRKGGMLLAGLRRLPPSITGPLPQVVGRQTEETRWSQELVSM